MSKKTRNPEVPGNKIVDATATNQSRLLPGRDLLFDPGAGLLVDGDLDMRIASNGTWFYKGSPINRKPLVKLFASVLRRDEAGDYWLQTPVERARITVDDAPFTAVELEVRGSRKKQILGFRTNLDEWVEADSQHPLRIEQDPESGEPRPYILVRAGLEALILRPVFYQLVDLAVEDKDLGQAGVWSKNRFFTLGSSV